MASILRVNTLTDASSNNSIATSFIFGGTGKSWINMNGESTISTRDSFNVSSIADRGTGLYTQNFTSNMTNDDFAGSGSAQAVYQDMDGRNRMMVGDAISTSAANVNTFDTGGSADDVGMVSSVVHGDLA